MELLPIGIIKKSNKVRPIHKLLKFNLNGYNKKKWVYMALNIA